MVRHSHENAFDENEFEVLLRGARELEPPFDEQTRLILLASGRLGMRAGELAHLHRDWIDWTSNLIRIPSKRPCSCGYCRLRANKRVEHDSDGLTFEEAFADRWHPKTEASARSIPFDFPNPHGMEDFIRGYFERNKEYPRSRTSINRRLKRLADQVGLPRDRIFPHCLRATAATWHSYRGVPAPALQNLMGWADGRIAQKYIRLSGGETARAIRDAHKD